MARVKKGKQATSPASIKVKSTLYAERMHPQEAATIGLKLTAETARALALKLLMVAEATEATGVIYVTGRPHDNSVSVIRRFT